MAGNNGHFLNFQEDNLLLFHSNTILNSVTSIESTLLFSDRSLVAMNFDKQFSKMSYGSSLTEAEEKHKGNI